MRYSVVVILWLLIAGVAVQARQIPPSSSLEKKVAHSDAIALTEAVRVLRHKNDTPGLHEYAVLRVIRTVKGQLPPQVSFVTRGFMSESDPACCVVGKRYLVFLKRGYPVLDVSNEMDVIVLREADNYVSPADGAHSAYEVDSGEVKDWVTEELSEANLCEVIRQIESKIKTTN